MRKGSLRDKSREIRVGQREKAMKKARGKECYLVKQPE